MSEITPGPWKVGLYLDHVVEDHGGNGLVADCRISGMSLDEAAANARAVAAVPDMLDALERLVGGMDSAMRIFEESPLYEGQCRIIEGGPLDAARKALAKAKGQPAEAPKHCDTPGCRNPALGRSIQIAPATNVRVCAECAKEMETNATDA